MQPPRPNTPDPAPADLAPDVKEGEELYHADMLEGTPASTMQQVTAQIPRSSNCTDSHPWYQQKTIRRGDNISYSASGTAQSR